MPRPLPTVPSARRLGPSTARVLAIAFPALALMSACAGEIGSEGAPASAQPSADGFNPALPGDVPGPASTLGGGAGSGNVPGSGGGPGVGVGVGGASTDAAGYKVFSPIPFDLRGNPLYLRAIPLTNDQWTESVRQILNLEAPPTNANSFLKPATGFSTFTNNESGLEVSHQMRADYQTAAASIAEGLLQDPGSIERINAGNDADTFIRTLVRRAYRRDATEQEVAAYQTLYDIGTQFEGAQSEFFKGANVVVEAVLQSPNFLYRPELTDDGAELTGYEVAARMSLMLTNKPPSDALLDRASAGEFDTEAGVATLADELLATEEATDIVVDMYATLYNFLGFRDIVKPVPLNPEVNTELDTVSRLFFERIYQENLGLEAILTSTQAFVGPLTAEYYGISPAPTQPTLTDVGPKRPGYFGQVPYSMVFADGNHPDPIHRGTNILFGVLCADLPAPPGEIPPVPEVEPGSTNSTNRDRVDAHTGIGTCGEACHGGYINPIGFAFEEFDSYGRIRTDDDGNPLNTTSAYPVEGQGMVEFTGVAGLMELLRQNTNAHQCFTKNMMSYALTRDITAADQAQLDQLTAKSMSEGASIKQILKDIVTSPAFRTRPGAIQ